MRASGVVAVTVSLVGVCRLAAAQGGAPAPGTAPMQAGGLVPPSSSSAPGGGLVPPPPGSGPSGPQSYAQPSAPFAQDSGDDSGRGLEFVLGGVSAGVAYSQLNAFSEHGKLLPSPLKEGGAGAFVDAAVALRLLYLTAGPEFRWTSLPDGSLWTLNLALGWRVPLGRLEPYAAVGGGYASVSTSDSASAPGGRSFGGFDVRVAGGVDYFVTPSFSVGGLASFDLLRVSRGGSSVPAGAGADSPLQAWGSKASAVGLSAGLGALAALHF